MKTKDELEKLDDLELTKALALLAGYVRRPDGFWQEVGMVGSCGIPNYANDLNVTAKVESTLTKDQKIQYAIHLYTMDGVGELGEGWDDVINYLTVFEIANSSARARTIALILTLQP